MGSGSLHSRLKLVIKNVNFQISGRLWNAEHTYDFQIWRAPSCHQSLRLLIIRCASLWRFRHPLTAFLRALMKNIHNFSNFRRRMKLLRTGSSMKKMRYLNFQEFSFLPFLGTKVPPPVIPEQFSHEGWAKGKFLLFSKIEPHLWTVLWFPAMQIKKYKIRRLFAGWKSSKRAAWHHPAPGSAPPPLHGLLPGEE